VVLPYFEPGACALQNNLESYASKRSLISIVSSGRSDERSRAALRIIEAMTTGIPENTRKRFKKKVNRLRGRKAVMPCYYNCPHEYVVRERDLFIPWAPWGCPEKDFQFFKKTIRTHGERKKWRHRCDVVLFDGRFVYWQIGPIINRTDRRSMMNGGRPPAKVLAQMRKRFWPTTADRKRYNYSVSSARPRGFEPLTF
jgi:hypothetical protein